MSCYGAGLEWGSRYGAGLGSRYGAVGSWCGAGLGLGVPLWGRDRALAMGLRWGPSMGLGLGLGVPLWGWMSCYGAELGLGVPLWGENLVMGQG